MIQGIGLLAGLALIWSGAAGLTNPEESGGPINLHLDGLVGSVLLTCGMASLLMLPPAWWRAAWPMSALMSLAGAGPNLWEFPPLEPDLFALHAGVPDPFVWPASGGWHVFGLAPVGIALAMLGRSPPGRATLLAGTGIGMVLAVAAVAWFVPEWPQGLLVMLPALLVGVLVGAGPIPTWVRFVGGQALVLLGLCAVIWAAGYLALAQHHTVLEPARWRYLPSAAKRFIEAWSA